MGTASSCQNISWAGQGEMLMPYYLSLAISSPIPDTSFVKFIRFMHTVTSISGIPHCFRDEAFFEDRPVRVTVFVHSTIFENVQKRVFYTANTNRILAHNNVTSRRNTRTHAPRTNYMHSTAAATSTVPPSDSALNFTLNSYPFPTYSITAAF